MHPGWPGIVPVCTCLPGVIVKGVPFPPRKYADRDDQLHGHPHATGFQSLAPHQDHMEGLLDHRRLCPTPSDSLSLGLGWGLGMGTYNKL